MGLPQTLHLVGWLTLVVITVVAHEDLVALQVRQGFWPILGGGTRSEARLDPARCRLHVLWMNVTPCVSDTVAHDYGAHGCCTPMLQTSPFSSCCVCLDTEAPPSPGGRISSMDGCP